MRPVAQSIMNKVTALSLLSNAVLVWKGSNGVGPGTRSCTARSDRGRVAGVGAAGGRPAGGASGVRRLDVWTASNLVASALAVGRGGRRWIPVSWRGVRLAGGARVRDVWTSGRPVTWSPVPTAAAVARAWLAERLHLG